MGRALRATVDAVTTARDHDLTLVQLIGALAAVSHELSGQELIRQLAVRLGAGVPTRAPPGDPGVGGLPRRLLAEPTIAGVLDLTLVGIGTPTFGSSSAVVAGMNLSAAEEKASWAAAPVGNLLGGVKTCPLSRWTQIDGLKLLT